MKVWKYILFGIMILCILITMVLAIKEKDYIGDEDGSIVMADAGNRTIVINKDTIIVLQICELIIILFCFKKRIMILPIIIFLIFNIAIFMIPVKHNYDSWIGGTRNNKYINIYNYTLKSE